MSGVEAVFMGGPADGELRDIQCDNPMDPPRSVTFLTPDPTIIANMVRGDQPPPEQPSKVVEHVYKRQVSALDHGPAWVYVWQEPADI